MKKKFLIYPFLLSIYPILGLYSRNLTEIPPREIIRPVIIAIFSTVIFLVFWRRVTKDRERSAFITGCLIYFYSGSELVYRLMDGYIPWDHTESFHLVILIVVTGMIFFLSSRRVWDGYMTHDRRKLLGNYLNLVSMIIIIFPLSIIFSFWIKAADDAPVPWSDFVGLKDHSQSLSINNQPDIYYIILDGYGRSDVLENLYGFSNTSFLDALRSRGFFIGDQSQSNYLRTSLSITSSLNMDYINFTADLAGAGSINRIPLFELAGNNRARKLLKEIGYQFVLVDSGSAFTRFYDADIFLTPFKTRLTLFEMWYYSTTAMNIFYQPELPVTPILLDYTPVAGFAAHRTFITKAFDQLAAIPALPGPKFIFAHLIAPHPPFVLDENGNSLYPNYPYVTGDGASYGADVDAYKKGYLGQVEYLNQKILVTLDAILEGSKIPPIIILQGDHGPGMLFMLQGDTLDSCLWERASILNAYYFPGDQTGQLYPAISPINSFRTIFNTFFDTSFEILPDLTYYSLFNKPYDFIDISNSVRPVCGLNDD